LKDRRGEVVSALILFFLLIIRGILLWLVVPLTTIAWLLLLPIRVIRYLKGKRHPSLWAYIVWADAAVTWVLEYAILSKQEKVRSGFNYRPPDWPKHGQRYRSSIFTDAI